MPDVGIGFQNKARVPVCLKRVLDLGIGPMSGRV